MASIILPRSTDGQTPRRLDTARQISIVGGAGAGKSRFMEELRKCCGKSAYCLSALSATFPEREESLLPGSIDSQFREASERKPYIRVNAVSELDKLFYMLFTDELEHLLAMKDSVRESGKTPVFKPTRLDRLKDLWERIFPGNRIVRREGRLLFSTPSGDDLIPASRLSQGEVTVLYYIAAVLYAPQNAVVFIDSPSLFLHPASLNTIWNSIEELRHDCTFVYNTVDPDFVNSRTQNVTVWVKSYDASKAAWDYETLMPGETRDDLFIDLIGTRKPVLFIEGDASHSIDARLYTLVFPDFTVRPLGSCDKVIETTRAFSGLRNMHHLDSHGIVDRDRRTDQEVEYLRKKNIMVPNVAEVENIFLAEGVIKTMADLRGRNPEKTFARVRQRVMREFRSHAEEQALMHVRHRMKRLVECRIDGRFNCITALETHIRQLINILNPRKEYNQMRGEFNTMVHDGDYASVLRVFNPKPLLVDSDVSRALGFKNKEEYIQGVLSVLKGRDKGASKLRDAIRALFNPLPYRGEAAAEPQKE